MSRKLGGCRAPQSTRDENAAAIAGQRLTSYYCARCRKLRQRGEMVDDKALGLVCAGGCTR